MCVSNFLYIENKYEKVAHTLAQIAPHPSLVFVSYWRHTETRFGEIMRVQGFIMGPMLNR